MARGSGPSGFSGRPHRLRRERKVRIRMLLDADAEGTDGDALRDREHERRARGDLAQSVAAGSHDAHTVDVGPSRVDFEAQALFLEVPEPPCHHFAKLVSSGEPAELQVEA